MSIEILKQLLKSIRSTRRQ